jgi:hypothetical protein
MNINKMNNNTSLLSYFIGWFSMLFGYLTLTEWATVVGMLATIFGFFVTWYYKHQDFKLKKRELLRKKYDSTKTKKDSR